MYVVFCNLHCEQMIQWLAVWVFFQGSAKRPKNLEREKSVCVYFCCCRWKETDRHEVADWFVVVREVHVSR